MRVVLAILLLISGLLYPFQPAAVETAQLEPYIRAHWAVTRPQLFESED